MAIALTQNAPAVGPDIVGRALQDLLPADDASGGRSLAQSEEVRISQPIAIYRLLPGALLKAHGIEDAEQVGWRYVIKGEAGAPGMVDLVGIDSDRLQFGQLSQNRHSESFVSALHSAQAEAIKSPELCEIRSLDMPSLHIAAVWVTSHPPAFIPYIVPRSFPGERLSVDYEFVEKLLSAAERNARRSPLRLQDGNP